MIERIITSEIFEMRLGAADYLCLNCCCADAVGVRRGRTSCPCRLGLCCKCGGAFDAAAESRETDTFRGGRDSL